jgi:hypothetical protein
MQGLHSIIDALTRCYVSAQFVYPRARNIAEADVEAAELHSLSSQSICVCGCQCMSAQTSAHLHHVNCARRGVRLRIHTC